MTALMRLSVLTLLLFLASPLSAFEARLIDENGNPMAGARVQELGGRGSVVVDSTGYFVLEPTPELPFHLLISRPDGVLIQPLQVSEIPESGVAELQVVATLSGSITVQGGTPDLELPPAVAVTIAGRTDLDRSSPMQVTDVLKGIPGTGVNGSGHTAVPALRGLASARTLILLDEGRVSSERRAGPSATFVDPASIEKVEIVRGPGSVAYGSDAMGGLIRMRTRLPSPGEEPSLRYSLTGGSNDRQRAVDAVATTSLLGGGFMVGGSYRSFDNYSSPEGEVPMSFMESFGVRAGYQHELGPGLLRFLWRSDLGRDVGKAAANSSTKPTKYPKEDSHRASLAYEQPGPGSWSRLGVSLFWDQYNLVTESDKLPTTTNNGTLAEADVFAHDYGLRVEAERAFGTTWRLLLGIDAAGRYGLHSSNSYLEYTSEGILVDTAFEESIESASKDDLGIFAGLSGTLGKVAISSGLRIDWVNTHNAGGYFGDLSTSQSDISGFIGGSISLGGGFDLSAQLASGFRDPLLSDRYYRGISGRGFITGNPDLKPETSLQADIALHFVSGPIGVSTFLYDYRIDDLIERYKEDGSYYFRNRGEAEVRGIEVEASWFLPKALEARLSASWQQGETDDDEWMDGVPPAGVVFTLRQDIKERWWWLSRIAAFDRDDRVGPNEVVVPGYTVFDASVGYRINENLDIQLLGRNLLNRSYFSSADDNAVLDPGRTIVINLRGRL